jgi:hypothetical protein
MGHVVQPRAAPRNAQRRAARRARGSVLRCRQRIPPTGGNPTTRLSIRTSATQLFVYANPPCSRPSTCRTIWPTCPTTAANRLRCSALDAVSGGRVGRRGQRTFPAGLPATRSSSLTPPVEPGDSRQPPIHRRRCQPCGFEVARVALDVASPHLQQLQVVARSIRTTGSVRIRVRAGCVRRGRRRGRRWLCAVGGSGDRGIGATPLMPSSYSCLVVMGPSVSARTRTPWLGRVPKL